MLWKFIDSITRRSGATEFINAALYALACLIAYWNHIPGAVWLMAIIGLCDIARFILCGAWFWAPLRKNGHYWCPQKDDTYKIGMLAKISFYAIILVAGIYLKIVHNDNLVVTNIERIAYYIVVLVSICEMLRTLGYVLDKYSDDWLEEKNGAEDWLETNCFVTIGIAALLCHLIATEFFGLPSGVLAIICLLLYIGIEEVANTLLWHHREPATRFFCWCESFCTKWFAITVITAVVIRLIHYQPEAAVWIVLFAVAIFARDIRLAIQHLRGVWHPYYISRADYICSGIRKWCIYIWIGVSLVTMQTENADLRCVIMGLVLIAILSVICIFLDYEDEQRSGSDYTDYLYRSNRPS